MLRLPFRWSHAATANAAELPGPDVPAQPSYGAFLNSRLDSLFASSSKQALVVVDMQKGFLCKDGTDELIGVCWQELVDDVELLVLKAVKAGWYIFVLEYERYGSTLWQINRHLQEYPLALKVRKDCCDGSSQLLKAEGAVTASRYMVCGVYADQCVRETAVGLASRLREAQVNVVSSACLPWSGGRDFSWTSFPTTTNLHVVNEPAMER